MPLFTDSITNDKVLLKQLTVKDAGVFFELYASAALQANAETSIFIPCETPEEFTNRIISACAFIWTIRPIAQPELIIGDCAIHHYSKDRKEAEIGGSLFGQYWGQGFMQAAFNLAIEVASVKLQTRMLLVRTKTTNLQAVRLAEKMGFEKVSADVQETVMSKVIA